MGRNKIDRRDLLERLLGMAKAQRLLLAENRFADLAATMTKREEILSSLKVSGKPRGSGEAALINEILRYDNNLRVSIEGELEETRHELERLSDCNTVHRAYVSGRVNMPRARSSRDG